MEKGTGKAQGEFCRFVCHAWRRRRAALLLHPAQRKWAKASVAAAFHSEELRNRVCWRGRNGIEGCARSIDDNFVVVVMDSDLIFCRKVIAIICSCDSVGIISPRY